MQVAEGVGLEADIDAVFAAAQVGDVRQDVDGLAQGEGERFCKVICPGERRVPSVSSKLSFSGWIVFPLILMCVIPVSLASLSRFFTENCTPSGRFFRLPKVYRRLSSMLGIYMGIPSVNLPI